MPDVLVDTSIWVDFFRSGDTKGAELLDTLLEEGRVVMCGIVEMELLAGVRAGARRKLAGLLEILPFLDVERRDFVAAGERLNVLRQRGITVPATDALIATLCVRHDLRFLTRDQHFEHFAEVKRLRAG